MVAPRACILLACVPLLGTTHARAQADDPSEPLRIEAPDDLVISTDRPGFANTPFTVPALHVQLETGLKFTSKDDGDTRQWEIGEPLVRVGVTEWAELRVTLPSWSYKDPSGSSPDSGATDSRIGTKLRITEQSGWVPNLGVVFEVTVPTGANAFTADDVQFDAELPWHYSVTDRVTLAGQLKIRSLVSDGNRYFEFAPVAALGVSPNDRLDTFFGYYGQFRARGGGAPAHTLQGGVMYRITNRVQLDVWGGVGLNNQADDYFVGGGISMLF